MTKENKEFIDAYIFMTYENMLKVFENEKLKVILQEECNDPTEFILQHQTSPNRANLNYGFLSLLPCGDTMEISTEAAAFISDFLISKIIREILISEYQTEKMTNTMF